MLYTTGLEEFRVIYNTRTIQEMLIPAAVFGKSSQGVNQWMDDTFAYANNFFVMMVTLRKILLK